jgi:hypothetical protein
MLESQTIDVEGREPAYISGVENREGISEHDRGSFTRGAEFYVFRAPATSVSQGRSSPRWLRSSASAKAAFCFRSPSRRASIASTAKGSSRLTSTHG